MRITVTLDDAVHEKLAVRAKEEGRSIANMAARLVDFALAEFNPGQTLTLRPAPDQRPHSRACGIHCPGHGRGCAPDCPTCHPILEEEGRRLASQREDLIASGVPASDLAVPLAPITVPEPKPSKSPPKEQPVKKTKGCAHLNTRYRMGRLHCTDCGDLL